MDEKKEPILSAYKIDFGKYKNKTLSEIAKENPANLLWLSGSVTKFSLKPDVQARYIELEKSFPETIEKIKENVNSCVCKVCLVGDCKRYQNCGFSKTSIRNYHYHPYGKRDP